MSWSGKEEIPLAIRLSEFVLSRLDFDQSFMRYYHLKSQPPPSTTSPRNIESTMTLTGHATSSYFYREAAVMS